MYDEKMFEIVKKRSTVEYIKKTDELHKDIKNYVRYLLFLGCDVKEIKAILGTAGIYVLMEIFKDDGLDIPEGVKREFHDVKSEDSKREMEYMLREDYMKNRVINSIIGIFLPILITIFLVIFLSKIQ